MPTFWGVYFLIFFLFDHLYWRYSAFLDFGGLFAFFEFSFLVLKIQKCFWTQDAHFWGGGVCFLTFFYWISSCGDIQLFFGFWGYFLNRFLDHFPKLFSKIRRYHLHREILLILKMVLKLIFNKIFMELLSVEVDVKNVTQFVGDFQGFLANNLI